MIIKNTKKEKYWDYFILVARFLIGWTFLNYGYSKLIDSQFGITSSEMATPLKDLNLFQVSWYLFDHQPFKAFIGVSQIICGILLIINRTVIIGALLFLPIVITILIIDLSFMPPTFANAFAWRLSFYILLDTLILYHYRYKMILVWKTITTDVSTRYKYKIWAYLVLPIAAIALEVIGILPKMIVALISKPTELWSDILKQINVLIEHL